MSQRFEPSSGRHKLASVSKLVKELDCNSSTRGFKSLRALQKGLNFARLAQLVRALALQARGRKFESFNEHQKKGDIMNIGKKILLICYFIIIVLLISVGICNLKLIRDNKKINEKYEKCLSQTKENRKIIDDLREIIDYYHIGNYDE